MAFDFEYKNNPVLSKIQNGTQLYYLKDTEARAALAHEISKLGSAAYRTATDTVVADSDNLVSSKAVIAYLEGTIADVTKALIFQGVADEGSDFTNNQVYIDGELINPSKGDVVLFGVKEYVFDGSKWVELGDEGLYLSKTEAATTYVKKTLTIAGVDLADDITADELFNALGLGALAKKSSATGTVAGQTITGVKATGTSTGSINVTLEATEKDVASTGKYTPSGNVTGSVTPSGSVSVTVSTSAADATLTKGDYTPAGTVAVALSGGEFNKITGVGTQASFTEGVYTPAELKTKDVTIAEHDHLSASVTEDETLVFSSAHIEALSFKAVDTFSGGSKASDTFIANSLPTMEAHTVGVQSASFSGTLAEDLVVTGVSYAKANSEATATFTGDKNDISATFSGTEGDVSVSGKCHDYAVKTAEFTGEAIELNVGDISVAAKDVTVQ